MESGSPTSGKHVSTASSSSPIGRSGTTAPDLVTFTLDFDGVPAVEVRAPIPEDWDLTPEPEDLGERIAFVASSPEGIEFRIIVEDLRGFDRLPDDHIDFYMSDLAERASGFEEHQRSTVTVDGYSGIRVGWETAGGRGDEFFVDVSGFGLRFQVAFEPDIPAGIGFLDDSLDRTTFNEM